MREKRPDGNPKIDETDIHMMIQESIGAGWLTVSFDVFFSIGQSKLTVRSRRIFEFFLNDSLNFLNSGINYFQ